MSDKEKDPGKNPLKKKKVSVTVTPEDGGWEKKQYSQKVQKRIKEDIEKAVEKAAPDGSDAQFDAADKKLDEHKRGVSKRQVKQIEVEIEGTRKDESGDDESVSRRRKVKPKD
jgi:hypothetical protein